MLSTRPVSRPR